VHFHHAHRKKNRACEAGQYFHVPFHWIYMNGLYKTQDEWMGKPQKHKRNQISFCLILAPRPILETNASDNFLQDWATLYVHKDDKTTVKV